MRTGNQRLYLHRRLEKKSTVHEKVPDKSGEKGSTCINESRTVSVDLSLQSLQLQMSRKYCLTSFWCQRSAIAVLKAQKQATESRDGKNGKTIMSNDVAAAGGYPSAPRPIIYPHPLLLPHLKTECNRVRNLSSMAPEATAHVRRAIYVHSVVGMQFFRALKVAILLQFLPIDPHFVRKDCNRSLKIAKLTLFFADRTSFRAKWLQPKFEHRNFTPVFDDRTSFRAKGLHFVAPPWHCPAP